MSNILKNIPTLLFVGFLGLSLLTTSCKNDDEASGNSNAIELFSFGPSPALRGGELIVIGQNLDKVTAIILPNNIEITNFTSKTPERITLTIPQETVEGNIILKTPEGDITSLTILTISEPIVLASFSPTTIRPGETLTINGDYLNLIKSVIFTASSSVGDSMFISQSREKIEVVVPDGAQTGIIQLSNGAEEMPIIIPSEEDLIVTIPQIISISPNPIKAGALLTIEGADLDLVRQVGFEGTPAVQAADFVNQSATTIEITVPDDCKDGDVKVLPGSFLEILSPEPIVMVVPQINSISPNPVKNGENITVTGVDLDLINRAIFGNNKIGAILGGGSDMEITVKVPISATEDSITFRTAAEKFVSSNELLELIRPTVTNISPQDAQFGEEITIEGNDLDLVSSVIFAGGVEASVNNATFNMTTVDIPVGATSGEIILVMKNGMQVPTATDYNVGVSTNAVITDMPSLVSHGEMMSIVGTDLNEITEIIFPVDVPATMFGQKTATLIEVFVPAAAATGVGNIKFITNIGEEFFSPTINIQGVDPVDDPALVFFNFDGLDAWWGDTGGIENDAILSLDGSNYFRVNAALSGWTGFFWRNGADNFPGATIGTDISGYALKFDINVLEPITGGEFAWRLKGSDGDFFHGWKPWEASGSFQTNGWITVAIPLTEFSDNGSPITDLNNITEDFGVAFNAGDSYVNVCIDNVRFEQL